MKLKAIKLLTFVIISNFAISCTDLTEEIIVEKNENQEIKVVERNHISKLDHSEEDVEGNHIDEPDNSEEDVEGNHIDEPDNSEEDVEGSHIDEPDNSEDDDE